MIAKATDVLYTVLSVPSGSSSVYLGGSTTKEGGKEEGKAQAKKWKRSEGAATHGVP